MHSCPAYQWLLVYQRNDVVQFYKKYVFVSHFLVPCLMGVWVLNCRDRILICSGTSWAFDRRPHTKCRFCSVVEACRSATVTWMATVATLSRWSTLLERQFTANSISRFSFITLHVRLMTVDKPQLNNSDYYCCYFLHPFIGLFFRQPG